MQFYEKIGSDICGAYANMVYSLHKKVFIRKNRECKMEFKRERYQSSMISKMNNGMIKVITGIRRCGKSYLVFTLFKNHLLEKGISRDHILEIALDDDSSIKLRDPIRLGEYIRKKTADDNQQYYVLIDEIQFCRKVKNPYAEGDHITFYEVLNGLLRRKNVDTYVTGSNSKMLSTDVLTEFRGRGDEIHVYPLDFDEYFFAVGGDYYDVLAEYQMYGGLPGAAVLDSPHEKADYLHSLFEELYLKDIIEHNRIKNEEGLETLIDVLASSVGSFTNPTKLSNTFKSRAKITYTAKTIASHIKWLKEAYMISEAKRYDIKGKKYIGANSKYYFTDLGLRNARLNYRQQEPTHLMENQIYNELLIRGYNVDVGIVEKNETGKNGKPCKKQLEVDFIAASGYEKYYIQSAYRMDDKEKEIQEKKSLRNINDSFRKIIITGDNTLPWKDDQGFLIISLKDFLLNTNALDL